MNNPHKREKTVQERQNKNLCNETEATASNPDAQSGCEGASG
jgi:hypothetical protein